MLVQSVDDPSTIKKLFAFDFIEKWFSGFCFFQTFYQTFDAVEKQLLFVTIFKISTKHALFKMDICKVFKREILLIM